MLGIINNCNAGLNERALQIFLRKTSIIALSFLTIMYNILPPSNTNLRAFESETEETHRLKPILASIKDNSEIVFGGKMPKSTAAILFCIMAIFTVTTSGVSGSKETIKKVGKKSCNHQMEKWG